MDYLVDLLKLINSQEYIVVGELGCKAGKSTKVIANYLKQRGNAKLIVVDWFQGSLNNSGIYVVTPGYKEEFLENMKPFEDIYTLMDLESGDAAKKIEDKTFDWFWIDADHRYHMVKRDLSLWYPKVKVGGILAGHDYEGPDYDEEFIEEDAVAVEGKSAIHHGVVKAVNEKFGIPKYESTFWWIRK